jgi:hypothetical protein
MLILAQMPQKPGAGQEMGYNDSSHKEIPDGQWG